MGLHNILIISEDKTDHLVLSSALARALPHRFTVSSANSLERPIDALLDPQNDAVILAHAPETEYLLRLAQKNNITTPLIVLVNEASAATLEKLNKLGAMDYLVRGNIPDQLLHRILDYSIELKHAKNTIKNLSNKDSLTGVLNRTGFRAHVERAVERSERYKFKTALLYINVDNFTHINDQYGEGAGDQLIKMISKRLANKMRSTDSVARLGGDEFAVVLEDVGDEQSVEAIANKLMTAISEPMTLNDSQVAIEVSVGGSVCPENGNKFEDLVECAKTSMLQAKAVRGNKYFLYTERLSFNIGGAATLAADLRQAVRKNQFELYYQPRIDLNGEQVVGLEALLRWIHPERGMIRPDEFLPMCETMGLMKTIGYQVIQQACEALNWLEEKGYGHIDVAVNISFSQFQDERFTEIVKDIIAKSGIDPNKLEFELTESTVLQNLADTKACMEELRELGISFSLDDFGTGFSQLSHMTELPISALKIDASFVRDVPTNKHQQAVCMMIIDMAKRLDLLVVAEGAEGLEQVQFLSDSKCHQVQGFYYSPAIPLQQLPRFIDEQRYKKSSLEA